MLVAVLCWTMSTSLSTGQPPNKDAADRIDYQRDILPILANHCYQCHGPDEKAREADLRLDTVSTPAVVPGQPAQSPLMQRVTSADPERRMPPSEPLRAVEIERLRAWIEAGAKRDQHWSFVPPRPSPLPSVDGNENTSAAQALHPIDRFIHASLASRGWQPAPRADRRTLIRRVTLDLTGLPPTPDEIDQFLRDRSPNAYERLVDRLLASPDYGEHMGVDWLDAARYADTHGYLFDTERAMWRWRDWVVAALNEGMPFDRFTLHQLAGDLVDEPSLASRIATGFQRNHIINNEAGANPAEYLVENVLDRVNTVGTVWLGLSIACAQCHDHKYDPISQREYYQLYALFNNIPEVGLDGLNTNAKPLLPAPTAEDQRLLEQLRSSVGSLEREMQDLLPRIDAGQASWEKTANAEREGRAATAPVAGRLASWPLDGDAQDEVSGQASAFEAADGGYETGVFRQSATFDGLAYLNAGDRFDWQADTPFTVSVWVRPDRATGRMSIFSRMENAEKLFRGYTLQLVAGQPALFLVHRFPDDMLQVQAKRTLEANKWSHLTVSYDGSRKAAGVVIYVDGQPAEVGLTIDKLTGEISNSEPFWLGNGHPGAKLFGRLDAVEVFDRALTADEVARLRGVTTDSLLAIPAPERQPYVRQRLRDHYLEHHAPPTWQGPFRELAKLREALKAQESEIPTVMVMQESPQPRPARMLQRGAFDQPTGEPLQAAVPAALGRLPDGAPANRLAFARWLLDPSHPLTARVAVNRIWQHHFGRGLVATPGDFGIQGEPPTHPQLLDTLASQFAADGWDVKRLQRMIVTSATYCQTSRVAADVYRRDPENKFLGRGPRRRLGAEAIRDQALAVSDLLVRRMGGPSVRPYQPPGLWREVAFDFSGNLTAQLYDQDQGASLYRRSMYTFWKRTAPPPTMLLFDAPDRERCTIRRATTSTPLQSLVLMNDPTYIEAARHLAGRMLCEGGTTPESQVRFGFRLLTARDASDEEVALLVDLFEQQQRRFAADTAAAEALLSVGESAVDEQFPAPALAGMLMVANVLLNLDEAITIP